MTAQGEKAYSYSQAGDDIVVGFFGDVARYLAVIRRIGPKSGFSPAEVSSALALNGPASRWTVEKAVPAQQPKPAKNARRTISPETPGVYYSLESEGRLFLGWQPGDRPFLFFLLPTYPGQPHLLLNEWHVSRAIP